MNSKLASEISTNVKSHGRHMAAFGVITIFLGLAAISAPALTGLSIVMVVGVFVIVGGILRTLWAFGAGSFGSGLLAIALAALTLLCGLALVTDPLIASGFLTVFIAIYLFADGLAEIVGSFQLQAHSARLWLLFAGIASMILAVSIWRQFPLSGAWAIGVLLGIKLLFAGIAMIAGGTTLQSIGKEVGALTRESQGMPVDERKEV